MLLEPYQTSAHAEFLRNEVGDSIVRIMAFLLHVPLLTLLTALVKRKLYRSLSWMHAGIEFGVLTCPTLLLMTSLSTHVVISCVMLLFAVFVLTTLHHKMDAGSEITLSNMEDG